MNMSNTGGINQMYSP